MLDMERIFLFCLYFLAGISGATKPKTIWDLIQNHNSLRQMSNYTSTHGLSLYFQQTEITAFIPTDIAFRYFNPSTYGYDMSKTATVQSLLLYHLAGKKLYHSDMKDNTTVMSLHPKGHQLHFNTFMDGSKKIYAVNGAVLITKDITASNGILHIIDRVIAPVASSKTLHDYLLQPEMPNIAFTSIAMASIIDRELKEMTNSTQHTFTAFSPNDSHLIQGIPEWAKDIIFHPSNLDLLEQVFYAHTVPDYLQYIASEGEINPKPSYKSVANLQIYKEGGETYVSCNRTRAKIIRSNIPTTNGVIHVIDRLLCFVYMNLKQTVEDLMETRSFADYLKKMDSSLLSQLQFTNRTYTLFVPVDEAFAKIPLSSQEQLNSNSSLLDKIIRGHIIQNLNANAEALGHDMTFTTLGQSPITILKINGEMYVESGDVRAKLLRRNIGCTNGVIHLISNVLLMRDFTVFDVIQGNSQLRKISTHISKHHDLRELLSSESKIFTVFLPGLLAMSNIPTYTEQNFEDNPVTIYEAIRGHIVENVVISSENITGHMTKTTVSGQKIVISNKNKGFHIVGNYIEAKVVVSDIWCSNGIVHIIDNLIQIPTRNILEESQHHHNLRIITNFLYLPTMQDIQRSLQSHDVQYTVFLPSDEAFSTMPRSRADGILMNTERLKLILKAHLVPNISIYKEDLIDGQSFRAQEEYVHVIKDQSEVFVINNNKKSKIIGGNIRGTNGLIHVIDSLLYYPYYTVADVMSQEPEMRPFYEMLSSIQEFTDAAESKYSLVTIFVPSASFLDSIPPQELQRYLQQIYMGHILPGARLDSKFLRQHLIDTYNVTSEYNVQFKLSNNSEGIKIDTGFENLRYDLDIVRKGTACSNGIVYIINGFLNLSLRNVFDEMRLHTLLKFSLDQFLKLLPDDTQTLMSDGDSNLTIFIPSDSAVQHLSKSDIIYINEKLNDTEKTLLFGRHIINGSIWKYKDLSKHPNLSKEMEKQDVKLERRSNGCFLKWMDIDAKILRSDILGSNGIVHIVDRYLFKAPGEVTEENATVKDISLATVNQSSSYILLTAAILFLIFCWR